MHLLDRNSPFHLFGEIDLFDKDIIRKNMVDLFSETDLDFDRV